LRLELSNGLDQVSETPAKPIEPPYHQRVPATEVIECAREPWALGQGAAGLVGEDPHAPDPLKRVELQRRLLIGSRDPRGADELTHRLGVSERSDVGAYASLMLDTASELSAKDPGAVGPGVAESLDFETRAEALQLATARLPLIASPKGR
jgi:hypothetical protein